MIIILGVFAAAFVIGYLLFWLRRIETEGGPALKRELDAVKEDVDDLRKRVVTLEAIIAAEETLPPISESDPVESSTQSRRSRKGTR